MNSKCSHLYRAGSASSRVRFFLFLAACVPVTCGLCSEQPTLVSQFSPASILSLRAREAGILEEVPVERGEKVSAGKILIRLDHYRQDYNLEVSRRRLDNRKGILMAESDLREKDAALEEAKGKHKRRQISDAQLVSAITQWELAKYRRESALDALEQAKLDFDLSERALDERFVRSPVVGKVMEVLKTVGERIGIGDVVVKVGDFSKLKAEIPLSKEAAAKLVAGGFLPVKTDLHGRQIKAVIESISAAPNSTKGEKIVSLLFDNPETAPADDLDSQAADSPPRTNLPNVAPPAPGPSASPQTGRN